MKYGFTAAKVQQTVNKIEELLNALVIEQVLVPNSFLSSLLINVNFRRR